MMYLPESQNHITYEIIEAHLGGFGKFPVDLIEFIKLFYSATDIYLDPVYTGKMMYLLIERSAQGFFAPGSTILVVHTGGLQGIHAYNYRYGEQLPSSNYFRDPILE